MQRALVMRLRSHKPAMNVLRMIKLFGWQSQVEQEIDKKRKVSSTLFGYIRSRHILSTNI
jgi:hypothetical protein